MASSSSPTGLLLFRSNNGSDFVVGKELGSGTCGSVHELIFSGQVSSEWCVKLALLGDTASRSKKQKEQVHHANLLHYENLIYRNHLGDLRGTFLPELPLGKQGPSQVFGEVDGYRFLIMERMETPLMEGCLNELREGPTKASSTIASVATRLVDICEAVHNKRHVIVDVKPENFMLARKGSSLASRIRMIDLGLMQSYGSVSGHRANDGIKDVIGTPMYVSLHVHDLSTPSRRDDLESIGYIICELVLKLREGDTAELPWASGGSDTAIGALKQAIMNDPGNRFWKTMPVLGEYFDEVNGLSYRETPDYDLLREILHKLRVKTKTPRGIQQKSSYANTPSRRTSGRGAKRISPGEVEDDSQAKFARVGETVSMEVEYVSHSDDDKDEEMIDWESDPGDDEDDGKPKANPVGLTLRCVEGLHEGEHFVLVRNVKESVTIGIDGDISLGGSNVDRVHARLTLHCTKKLQKLKVEDLQSSTGTFLNRTRIPKGKHSMAFINDKISIGDTVWKVCQLKPEDVTGRACAGPIVLPIEEDEDENQPPRVTRSKRKGAAAKPTEAAVVLKPLSQNKDSVTLAKGRSESAVIGNAKLTLSVGRGYCSVSVIPKTSSSRVLVNGKQIVVKKGAMAFLGDQVDVDGKGSIYKLQTL